MLQTKCLAAAAVTLVGIAPPGLSLAATLNVPGDFATIQACIDAAFSGVDECVVAPGTYHETINFLGKAITLRSSGGADVTTIDATGIGGSVVTCASGEGPDTVLHGFTITGGTGGVPPAPRVGGGMYNDHSSPTVVGCTFIDNTASRGGAMYNKGSTLRVTKCVFQENRASAGAGIYNEDSNPAVSDCTFIKNIGSGGGIYNLRSAPIVTSCLFRGNFAGGNGGTVYNVSSNPTFKRCQFAGNASLHNAGGIYSDGSKLTVIDCMFSGNRSDVSGIALLSVNDGDSTVTNCVFVGHRGSALLLHRGRPTLSNCTFAGNSFGGVSPHGGVSLFDSDATVTGCIFWHDSLVFFVKLGTSIPVIRFSNVQGGLPDGVVDGGGNIDLEPMFVRRPDPGPDGAWGGVDDDYGDLRLQAGSPCINAGDPGFAPQPSETDLEGHARVLCGRVDMGAYEFGIGDYDCNQTVDLTDFAAWNACMTGPLDSGAFHSTIDIRHSTIGCEAFDFDGDGDVDLFDFGGYQRIAGP